MANVYIQESIRCLKKLEGIKEKLDFQIKEHQEEIKHYMQLHNLEELYGIDGEKIIYKEILGKRFDTKEFKKQFESLYNSYLRNTRNLRFQFNY